MKNPVSHKWIVAGLLACHLLLALAFSAANPPGEAPDEADHWAYVVHLAQTRALPVGPEITQSKHPPLYHATAALIADLFADPAFGFLRANPDLRIPPPPEGPLNFFIHTAQESWPWQGGPLAFHVARLWSILLSLGTIAALYGLLREAFPDEPEVAVTGAGVLAFLPTFAFIGSAVSNDGPAAFFATAALWGGFAIHRRGRLAAGWWTPLALGLGVLTKVSVVAVWLPVALLVFNLPGSGQSQIFAHSFRGRFPEGLRSLLAVFLPAGLLAAPWFVRNWLLYGDPTGVALARQTIDQRLSPWTWADSWWLVKGWFLSFWGRYGAIGQIAQPAWLDWLLLGLTLLAVAGVALRWRQGRNRFALGILLLALLCVAAVMGQYSLVALGTDQGRLLYPALGAIVGLWVVGLVGSVGALERRGGRAGFLLVGVTALWSVGVLMGVIGPAYSPAPVVVDDPPRTEFAPVDFGEIQLAGAELGDSLTLFWAAVQPPGEDWRTVMRVTGADGTLVWEWQRSPGQGRFATDRWPAGVTVRDAYDIRWPDWAGPGRYRVEVGVRAFGGEWALPSRAGQPAAGPEHPFVELGWIAR